MVVPRAPKPSIAVAIATVLLTGAFGWLAVDADLAAPGATAPLVLLDLTVGVAFLLAALVARGSAVERVLFGLVGLAWLAGSVLAPARSVHQGVLVVALVAFPTGRVRGIARWLCVAAGAVVMSGFVPQLGVAVVFAAVALVVVGSAAGPGRGGRDAAFPTFSAATLAAVLTFAWWSVHRQSPVSPLVPYSITLLAVAAGFAVATLVLAGSRKGLTDDVLGDAPVAGIAGLRAVLSRALRDPQLDITLGVPSPAVAGVGLTVYDGAEPLACVVSASAALTDRGTADAVAAAVRLTVLNERLGEEQARLAAELEASRARLLAATDRERQRIAARLRSDVGVGLDRARATLAAVPTGSGPDVDAVVTFSVVEIGAAADEVGRIIAGIAPADLGEGRLRRAIEELARRSRTPITCRFDAAATGSRNAEETLFYVCSEALANAAKHSGAAAVEINLAQAGEELVLTVRDDGTGGADPRGSGLQGLADRVAAAGGSLSVVSPAGKGTLVAVSLPNRRA